MMTPAAILDTSLQGKRIPFTQAPVIDFAPAEGGTRAGKLEVAKHLRDACINAGFMYVKNSGVTLSLVESTFSWAKRFLEETTPEQKQAVSMAVHGHNRGYFTIGEENLDPTSQAAGDLKEGYNIGRELAADDPDRNTPLCGTNAWPENFPGFREAMLAYFDAMNDLSRRMIRIFALSLDMPEDYFDKMVDRPLATMRFLHYPPQEGVITEEQLGCGAHTDFGCFTFLAQDGVGGLQARNVAGEWIEIPSRTDCFVMNIGDMFQRWTNDLYISTLHRVINTSEKDRYSLPFFFDPNADAHIEALPTCVTPERPARYAPTTGLKHIMERLSAGYGFDIVNGGDRKEGM